MYKKLFYALLAVNLVVLAGGILFLFSRLDLVKTAWARLTGKSTNRWQEETQKHAVYDAQNGQYAVVMLGNSITQQAQWNELLNRPDVANRGISGDIISGMLQRITAVLKLQPKIIIIMAGINDILYRGQAADQVFASYKQLLEVIQQGGSEPVITSTLFIANAGGRVNEQVAMLNALLLNYCQAQRLTFIDLNQDLSTNNRLLEKYTYDGIHLNSEGYRIWRDYINQVLGSKLKPMHSREANH